MRHRVSAILAAAVATVTAMPTSAQQPQLGWTGWGGAPQLAQRKAFLEPFATANNVKIVEDEWQGELAKLRAMVTSGNITWDIVLPSSGSIDIACDEGLLEKLDMAKIAPKEKLVDGAAHPCGVMTHIWGFIFAYDKTKFPNGGPRNYPEFWDVQKFPGPRALRKNSRHSLEAAILATGAPASEVYKILSTKEGVDLAFRKLEEIKPHVKVWYTALTQPQQLLADGEVVMTTGLSARFIDAMRNEKKGNFELVWDGMGWGADYLSIVKGSKNIDLATKMIAFATAPEQNAAQTQWLTYGPTHKDAIAKVAADLAPLLPTYGSNMKNAFLFDRVFYANFGDELSQRFNAWINK